MSSPHLEPHRTSSCHILALIVLLLPLCAHAQERGEFQWRSAGENLANSRSQPVETVIGPANVHALAPKWTFTAGGFVSATPTVDGEAVYFPDVSGNLFSVERGTGNLIWSHKISDYDGVVGSKTRVSPVIDGDQIFVGDQTPGGRGANVISIDRATGALRWITQVESHPAAIITGSPVVFDGLVYIGVSSGEEGLAETPSYPCCTFRGSIVALDAATGKIVWKTYTIPENGGTPGGYSGAAVWQAPAIDVRRGTLYIGTGNNYTAPASVETCQVANPTTDCTVADDYFDSLLALDMKTGKIKWGKKLQTFDTWTLVCKHTSVPEPNCPVLSSPDFDFGSGPNLLGDIVGIGQKSGIYWAIDAETGNVRWGTSVGPSGALGGILWGTATDGRRIYVAIANDEKHSYTLTPSGQTITWGAWSALDVRTGKILWQTADPTPGAIDAGSVSVANEVVYAGSYSGHMYALSARTGEILWDFNSGGSIIDGPSIVDGSIYFGSGYKAPGIGNDKVYAFTLPESARYRHHPLYDLDDRFW